MRRSGKGQERRKLENEVKFEGVKEDVKGGHKSSSKLARPDREIRRTDDGTPGGQTKRKGRRR